MKSTRRVRRRKQTRRKRRGGKKLGEGTNGIVIDPAIACKTKDTTGKVSKVFFKRMRFERARDSITPVLAKLKEIDPNYKYFLYPEFCSNIGKLSPDNIADGVTEKNKYYSYLMPRAGKNQTLMEFIKTTNPSEDELVLILQQVEKVVDILHKNNIFHGDFHSENVLRMDDGTFRIIDFDASRIVTEEELKPVYTEPYLRPSYMKEQLDSEVHYIVEQVSIIMKLKFKYLLDKVFPKPDSHHGSRTGGVVHRSSRRTQYRSRRG